MEQPRLSSRPSVSLQMVTPTRLDVSVTSFHSQFECLGDVVDLNEVIAAPKKATLLAPDGRRNKSAFSVP